jgi:hypothetical protein
MDWFVTGYWAVVAATTIFSALLTWQAFEHRRYARSRAKHPISDGLNRHIALFVPCKGHDDDLAGNLRPLFEQEGVSYELVFIVESEHDPAAAIIRRMMHESGRVRSSLVVAGLATESGQKVHNLLAATANIPAEAGVLAFVDADVRPPRDWLRRLTGRLHNFPVTTGYRYFMPKNNSFANLALASLNGSIIPIMFPGKHHLIWGGSWAVSREVFESSGLREEWRGTLSDDLIATRTMARLSHRVSAEPMCILPSPLEVDARGMLSFIRRQLVIGRCYTPVHWYALLGGAALLQFTLWGSLLAAVIGLIRGADWAFQPAAAFGVLYFLQWKRARLRHAACRLYLPTRLTELKPIHRFDAWLGPIAGAVGLIGLVASGTTRRIVWKGITYDMQPGGTLSNIERPEPFAQQSNTSGARRAA